MRDRSSDIYKKSSVDISFSVANLILTENFSLILTSNLFVNNSETVSPYDISGFDVPIESDSSYHREIELSNTPNTISRQALHFQNILSVMGCWFDYNT